MTNDAKRLPITTPYFIANPGLMLLQAGQALTAPKALRLGEVWSNIETTLTRNLSLTLTLTLTLRLGEVLSNLPVPRLTLTLTLTLVFMT